MVAAGGERVVEGVDQVVVIASRKMRIAVQVGADVAAATTIEMIAGSQHGAAPHGRRR